MQGFPRPHMTIEAAPQELAALRSTIRQALIGRETSAPNAVPLDILPQGQLEAITQSLQEQLNRCKSHYLTIAGKFSPDLAGHVELAFQSLEDPPHLFPTPEGLVEPFEGERTPQGLRILTTDFVVSSVALERTSQDNLPDAASLLYLIDAVERTLKDIELEIRKTQHRIEGKDRKIARAISRQGTVLRKIRHWKPEHDVDPEEWERGLRDHAEEIEDQSGAQMIIHDSEHAIRKCQTHRTELQERGEQLLNALGRLDYETVKLLTSENWEASRTDLITALSCIPVQVSLIDKKPSPPAISVNGKWRTKRIIRLVGASAFLATAIPIGMILGQRNAAKQVLRSLGGAEYEQIFYDLDSGEQGIFLSQLEYRTTLKKQIETISALAKQTKDLTDSLAADRMTATSLLDLTEQETENAVSILNSHAGFLEDSSPALVNLNKEISELEAYMGYLLGAIEFELKEILYPLAVLNETEEALQQSTHVSIGFEETTGFLRGNVSFLLPVKVNEYLRSSGAWIYAETDDGVHLGSVEPTERTSRYQISFNTSTSSSEHLSREVILYLAFPEDVAYEMIRVGQS